MKIYIAELQSMKHPAIRKMILQISRKTHLLPAAARAASAQLEMPKSVQQYENRDADATISIMPPDVFAESMKIGTRSRRRMSL